ncbi:12006_t:CDS:2 [Cetraspora pellucida]|uniref:12006_t:CDS:1 n=1 Tax=Cetraspora pellucida TaxID=1433469 RepID=A0A9N9EC67_9GLOM|nr:12006_t:CDS:2 [Cetraspora pellucida]
MDLKTLLSMLKKANIVSIIKKLNQLLNLQSSQEAVVAESTLSLAQSRQNARAVIAKNTLPLILNYDKSNKTGIDNKNNEDEFFYDFGDLEELMFVNFKDKAEKFCKIINIMIVFFQTGSGYY